MEVLTDTNPKSFDVGEIFVLEALASGDPSMVILVIEHWIKINEVKHCLQTLDQLPTRWTVTDTG